MYIVYSDRNSLFFLFFLNWGEFVGTTKSHSTIKCMKHDLKGTALPWFWHPDRHAISFMNLAIQSESANVLLFFTMSLFFSILVTPFLNLNLFLFPVLQVPFLSYSFFYLIVHLKSLRGHDKQDSLKILITTVKKKIVA